MTPEERDLITGLFERLKSADGATKDREADDLINRLVVQQPSTPYLLTQTVLVHEHALKNAQARIAQLESELATAKQSGGQGEASGAGSFLGGLVGRGPWGARGDGSASASAPAAQPAAAAAPMPRAASAPMPTGSVPFTASTGGGFLQQALSTAAGVAGGALLFDGIRSLFFHNPGPFGSALGGGWGSTIGGQPLGGVNETNIANNYYGNDPSTSDPAGGIVDTGNAPDGSATDASQVDDSSNAQDTDAGGFDTASDFDSGSGDFGGGDDSSFT